jgi:hypothetical protein
MTLPAIQLTKLSSSGGALTKQIRLDANGALVKGQAGTLWRGMAERVKITSVATLASFIEGLTSNQALALGSLRGDLPDLISVGTVGNLNGTARPGIIARVATNIIYSGPAFSLLDFDSKGMAPSVAANLAQAGGLWPALLSVLPNLNTIARVTRNSTSSGLSRSDTGATLPGSDGVHTFVAVKEGGDADRFLHVLHDRCWLAGYGWIMVGAAGTPLERSIVDRTCGGPERLVYEGAPVLLPPLVQDAASRRATAVDGAVLDTAAICPDLSLVEQARLRELKAQERARLAPELAKARVKFIAEKAQALAARTGATPQAAAHAIARQCEGVLLPDIELPFDAPKLAGKTVGDVLANPQKFEGETLADPLEGVDYGRCKAKILLRADGTPWIHSFAHGLTTYELKLDAAAVRKAMEAATTSDVVEVYAKAVASADLSVVNQAELRRLAKQLSGAGMAAIDDALKAATQQQANARAQARRARQAARRRDSRPHIAAPFPDEPWLPLMDTLNEVIGASNADMPPSRDADKDCASMRKFPIPTTHAFTTANEGDDT